MSASAREKRAALHRVQCLFVSLDVRRHAETSTRSHSSVPAIECGHGAIGFSFDSLLFEVVPFVDGRLSSSDTDFDFHTAVLPIEPERDKRLSLDRAGGK